MTPHPTPPGPRRVRAGIGDGERGRCDRCREAYADSILSLAPLGRGLGTAPRSGSAHRPLARLAGIKDKAGVERETPRGTPTAANTEPYHSWLAALVRPLPSARARGELQRIR